MAQIELDALDALDIQVHRSDDEYGNVMLIVRTDEGTVRIRAGRTEDDAAELTNTLCLAMEQAAAIRDNWDDRPDEHDNYVTLDRGRYYVTFSGRIKPDGQPRNGYPAREIAVYELAKLMAERGEFGASWIEGTDNCPVGIDAEVRAFHDAGGGQLLPLPGARFSEDDALRDADGSVWNVHRDYGTGLGVWLYAPGDPEVDRVASHDEITRAYTDVYRDQD